MSGCLAVSYSQSQSTRLWGTKDQFLKVLSLETERKSPTSPSVCVCLRQSFQGARWQPPSGAFTIKTPEYSPRVTIKRHMSITQADEWVPDVFFLISSSPLSFNESGCQTVSQQSCQTHLCFGSATGLAVGRQPRASGRYSQTDFLPSVGGRRQEWEWPNA